MVLELGLSCCPSWSILLVLAIGSVLYLLKRHLCRSRFPYPFVPPDKFPQDPDAPLPGHNRDQRDDILEQRFSQDNIPPQLDAIIIGSGIGGLATATLLAKCGCRCLVLEQHYRAGGCCHTYKKKGYEFDVGIHYIGEMHPRSKSRRMIDQLTEGRLQWAPIDEEHDVFYLASDTSGKSRRFVFIKGRENLKSRFLTEFPSESQAIEKLFKILQSLRGKAVHLVILKVLPRSLVKFLIWTGLLPRLSVYFYYNQRSLQEVLDELTSNEELKATISYCFGDYGTMPSESPFTVHSLLLNHFIDGGYYPVGGAAEIALNLIPVIEKAGGRVLGRARVTQILCTDSGDRAVGVRVQISDKEKKDGSSAPTFVDVFAPTVISAAGVTTTCKLLPESAVQRTRLPRILSAAHSGPAAFSLFVGLKVGQPKLTELGIRAQNMWAFTSAPPERSLRDFLALPIDKVASAEIPMLFISFPSSKDPTWDMRHPGKSSMVVVTFGNWNWFKEWEGTRKKKRGDNYVHFKDVFTRRILEMTMDLYPQLRSVEIEYQTLGTPLTNTHYLNSPRGEIYGLDHTLDRFSPEIASLLRPDVGLPGLLLSGQDILSCGFMGALYGGVLCASSYLQRNLMSDLGLAYGRKKSCCK